MDNFEEINRKIDEIRDLIIAEMSEVSNSLYDETENRKGDFYCFRDLYSALDRSAMLKNWIERAKTDKGLPF